MLRKEEIQHSVANAFQTYENLLSLAGVTDEKFYNWFNKFEKYHDVKRVSRFFFIGPNCFTNKLRIVDKLYKELTPEEWKTLLDLNRNSQYVITLREGLRMISARWRQRPKAPRKSE